jgi:4-hydroxybenzoate polyprenyltransferase
MAVEQGRGVAPAALEGRVAWRSNTLAVIVEAMRPRQWTKNAFVLAGLVFSGQVLELDAQINAWMATIAFCLISGATYLVNDAADAETDRLNPRTARRPIARGDLSVGTARVAAVVAAAIAFGLAALVNWETLAVVGGFLVLQLAYSGGLKHVLFLDVMIIASGFVLRALAGLVALGPMISEWLLLCTGLLALFIGLAKRRGEAVALGGKEHPQRPVLESYSVVLLDELIAVVTPSVLMVYALYAAIGAQAGNVMLVTLPFVLYGIFRVLFLIHHKNGTEEPELIVWKDKPLLLCVLLWGLVSGVIGVVAN